MNRLQKLVSFSTLALVLSCATAFGAEVLTPYQKRIPGPKKLAMTEANYSGEVHNDLEYIADRQAIINHVTAYSFLFDEHRFNEWYDLFTDDVSFETTAPCLGTIIIKGKEAYKAFVNLRMVDPSKKEVKTVRRHTMGQIHVAKQTKNTAEVRTYLIISTVSPNDGTMTVITTGTYNGTLVKRNGKWKISRWYIETDAPLHSSPMPQDEKLKKAITFIPDNREVCKKR